MFTQENSGTPYSGVAVFMVSNEYKFKCNNINNYTYSLLNQ